ncbi:MAG: sugar ABC transporter permease [Bacilli bacterium]|nr:sugar ABC transporter permease [Bacilli bacterium]
MKRRNHLYGLLFISPWIIGFLAFVAYPLYRTIYFSFHTVRYSGELGYLYDFVGIENYKRILTIEADFVIELQNYIVKTLLYVPVIIALSIIIAILLNSKLKGTAFFRLIFFLPIIILNGELMKNMRNYGGMDLEVGGIIHSIINRIVPESIIPLFIELFAMVSELLWYCGVPILIFLAALQKIDKSLYEAAEIDGASFWNIFWKITLPIIYPLISVVIVYVVVFLANFDANPINSIIRSSRTDPSRREGYASALSIIYAFAQTALIGVLFFITRRREKGGIN